MNPIDNITVVIICMVISGDTLVWDNCQIIGMLLILLARQAQKNCDQSVIIGSSRQAQFLPKSNIDISA